MSDKIVERVSELLNQEKWTRATLNNYTVANFTELDELLDDVVKDDAAQEVLELCDEHLIHTKNSIIGLYVSGVVHLSRQTMDDSNLVSLIEIFTDNHKWNIVEYLCRRILEFGENRFALRTLADCYDNESQIEKKYDVWERLIRVDYDEADIVRHLAEKREEDGLIEEAVDYYKKALHRYINKRQFNSIKEVWHKLIQYAADETEFFYHAESRIAKTVSPERSVQLLEDLYPHFKGKNPNTSIDILKRVLEYDPKNPWARKEITECFQEKYGAHSQLDEYIRLSNLNQSWRNVHDAIADFEKHIAFDEGNFVYHRSWGVGIIRSIKGDQIVIDFARKRGHSMTLKMAVGALEILPKDHLWVLRSVWKKEKLREKIKKDIVWGLRTVIKSSDNAADMKKVKAELVPSILTAGEWSSWSTKARGILKTNSTFGVLPDKADHFVVRDQPITLGEKTHNKFKGAKSYFEKIRILEEFLEYMDSEIEAGTDSEFFREMVDYFVASIKSATTMNETVVAGYLLVSRIVEKHRYFDVGLELDFRTMYDQIDGVEAVFGAIDSTELKREFVHKLREHVEEWPQLYVRLFPHYLSRDIIGELERAGHHDRLVELFMRVYENYREYREAFVWLARNVIDDRWFSRLNIGYEKILIAMIHLLDLTFRDIDNRRDVSQNRKINRQIHNFLFKDNTIRQYLSQADEDGINRVYTLVRDVKELDPSIKIELKQQIMNEHPGFHFYGETDEIESVSRGGFMVTLASYQEKQRALKHLHEVDVPQNSKEIGEAAALGDLKENAEYKAAKERQDLLNSSAARMQDELDKATIIRPEDLDATAVSFGTKVTLRGPNDESEHYTVLGPWESDPEHRVISYLSPLGHELLNAKVGQRLEFTINERKYEFDVERIEPVEL
ncbi:MAG: transcription elongation factor GreA [Spirochaetaceae bacterium]|nr:MAG: transcription elongation factor GreA [Spirochaetaceae bacterium]